MDLLFVLFSSSKLTCILHILHLIGSLGLQYFMGHLFDNALSHRPNQSFETVSVQ